MCISWFYFLAINFYTCEATSHYNLYVHFYTWANVYSLVYFKMGEDTLYIIRKIANKIYPEVFMQLKGRQIQKQFLNSLNQQQNKHKSLQNTSCNIMPVWVKQNWDLMSQKNMTWLFPLFSFNGLVNYEDPASGFCIISHPRVPKKKNQLIRWKQSKISRLIHWKK